VPCDGLSFAVRVRGQIDCIGGLGCGFQFADNLGLAGNDLIIRGEIVVLVHTKRLGGEIAHVSHGCFHFIPAAQKLFDGFDFGGRFNND